MLIYFFFLRIEFTVNKAESAYSNVYFNDAYCTGFGEQAIETKGGDEAFSSGNVSQANIGEHYYVAVDNLHAPANHSAAVLKG